jgi:intraflagellar transport protein 52
MQPDTGLLAEQIKSCLQETDEVPRDITSLFDSSLYKLDTSLVPKAIK